MNRTQRYRRLVELNAPRVILAGEAAQVQRHFDDVFVLVTGSGAEAAPAEVVPLSAQHAAVEWYDDLSGLIWLDDERLVLTKATTLEVFSRDGSRLHEMKIAPGKPHGIFEEHYLMLLNDPSWMVDPEYGLCDVQLIDVRTWDLLAEIPASVPLYAVVNDQPEDLFRVDIRAGRAAQLRLGGDRPRLGGTSRDGAHALVFGDGVPGDGTIMELSTGKTLVNLDRLVDPEAFQEWVLFDGTKLDMAQYFELAAAADADPQNQELVAVLEDIEEKLCETVGDRVVFDQYPENAAALVLTNDRWRYLSPRG